MKEQVLLNRVPEQWSNEKTKNGKNFKGLKITKSLKNAKIRWKQRVKEACLIRHGKAFRCAFDSFNGRLCHSMYTILERNVLPQGRNGGIFNSVFRVDNLQVSFGHSITVCFSELLNFISLSSHFCFTI